MFVCDLRKMAVNALAFLGNKLFVSIAFLGIQLLCKLWDWYFHDLFASIIGPGIQDKPKIPEGDFASGVAQTLMPSWGTLIRIGSSSLASLATWAMAQG